MWPILRVRNRCASGTPPSATTPGVSRSFTTTTANATFDDRATSEAASCCYGSSSRNAIPPFAGARPRDRVHAREPIPGRRLAAALPGARCLRAGRRPDYTAYLTFNDDVAAENIDFLMLCHRAFGGERFLDPIRRGMAFFAAAQLPAPQAGWALQYTSTCSRRPPGPTSEGAHDADHRAQHRTAAGVLSMTGDAHLIARISRGSRMAGVVPPSGRSRPGRLFPSDVHRGRNAQPALPASNRLERAQRALPRRPGPAEHGHALLLVSKRRSFRPAFGLRGDAEALRFRARRGLGRCGRRRVASHCRATSSSTKAGRRAAARAVEGVWWIRPAGR